MQWVCRIFKKIDFVLQPMVAVASELFCSRRLK
jgi:hypothetical protein